MSFVGSRVHTCNACYFQYAITIAKATQLLVISKTTQNVSLTWFDSGSSFCCICMSFVDVIHGIKSTISQRQQAWEQQQYPLTSTNGATVTHPRPVAFVRPLIRIQKAPLFTHCNIRRGSGVSAVIAAQRVSLMWATGCDSSSVVSAGCCGDSRPGCRHDGSGCRYEGRLRCLGNILRAPWQYGNNNSRTGNELRQAASDDAITGNDLNYNNISIILLNGHMRITDLVWWR